MVSSGRCRRVGKNAWHGASAWAKAPISGPPEIGITICANRAGPICVAILPTRTGDATRLCPPYESTILSLQKSQHRVDIDLRLLEVGDVRGLERRQPCDLDGLLDR